MTQIKQKWETSGYFGLLGELQARMCRSCKDGRGGRNPGQKLPSSFAVFGLIYHVHS